MTRRRKSPTPSSSTARRSTSARVRRSSAPARRVGIKLPHLCYSPKPGYRPDGNCRVCMVEIEGERVLAASCIRTPTPGMKVKTADRSRQERASHGGRAAARRPARAGASRTIRIPSSGRSSSARRSRPAVSRASRDVPAPDRSHPAMAVNLDACIQCNLCVRACREVQVNDVIGMAGRGHTRRSCSTSTIRWATRPASPAANACRPARPAR